MKLVISDYPDTLKRDLPYEVRLLKEAFPDSEVVIYPYVNQEELAGQLQDADGLLTAFLPVDGALLDRCPHLRCVSFNATGYNSIDLNAASERGVAVCAIREYCTEDVADFTMSLLLSLAKKLKAQQYHVERDHLWQYRLVGPVLRLRGKTLAIFGFGRIGQAVAARAKAFGLEILAVDPYLPPAVADAQNVRLVSPEEACRSADFLSNHMIATPENTRFFDRTRFQSMEHHPVFLNAARAETVDEGALVEALDQGWISAAGLDVLSGMGLDLDRNPLLNRENVIVTPHAAFYTVESLKALQDISCQNLIAYLKGEPQKIFSWVNIRQIHIPRT